MAKEKKPPLSPTGIERAKHNLKKRLDKFIQDKNELEARKITGLKELEERTKTFKKNIAFALEHKQKQIDETKAILNTL